MCSSDLDSRTPDGHALAGPVPGVPGLFVLTGGNGKGFKFGPSMGRALADVVRGADFAASPLAPFAVDRAARGQVIRGEHEYAWGSFARAGGTACRYSTPSAIRRSCGCWS